MEKYEELIKKWSTISHFLILPNNEDEFDKFIDLADFIIDETKDDENHPLIGLLDIVGLVIADYEMRNIVEPTFGGRHGII